MLVKKSITQTEKIQALYSLLKEGRVLLFIASSKTNRLELRAERKAFLKEHFVFYKTNIYRAEQVFGSIDVFNHLLGAIHGAFFVAYSKKARTWSKLTDIFDLGTKYTQPLFVLQKKTFAGRTRILTVTNLRNKKHLAWHMNINTVFVLIKGVLSFLLFNVKSKIAGSAI